MTSSAELPSKEDLRKLSLREAVAYAVRAASRVEPLCSSLDEKSRRAVGDAIRLGRNFVEGRPVTEVALDAANQVRLANVGENAARFGMLAAASAADALAVTPAGDADCAASAAEAAADAAQQVLAIGCRRDFERLAKLASHQAGARGDPIDFSELDPLQPMGDPLLVNSPVGVEQEAGAI